MKYSPKSDITSYTGSVLFYKDKEYVFIDNRIKDEFGCIRNFEEKEFERLFKLSEGLRLYDS